MDKNINYAVSVVMPVYNGETTIIKALDSLFEQSYKIKELIIVNDGSTDNSINLLTAYLTQQKIDYKIIIHETSLGLAKSYNEAIKLAKGDLIVTMHQDVILMRNALENLVQPFKNKNVVAASHVVTHPIEIWNKYNFWQKCFFARLVEKDFSGIDGKFDCFRKEALEKAGLFDEDNYRSAGEDGDMVFKLKSIGKIVETQSKIIHLHKISNKFSYKDIIHKQKQYSEAQGVLFIHGRIRNFGIVRAFFREILLLCLFISYLQLASLFLIFIYSFYYTKIVFLKEYGDKRIILLPFMNIFLLLISFIYSLRGIIYGKQRI